MEKPVLLDKFLADAGAGTRSEVKKYIQKGQVQVNGKSVKKPELKVTEEDQVVMNMIFVYMGSKYKFILAAQDFFCKLHADLMGLFRRDLPRLKGLDQMATQVRSLVDGMAAGPGKFDIRGLGGAAIGRNKQLSVRLFRVADIVNGCFQR